MTDTKATAAKPAPPRKPLIKLPEILPAHPEAPEHLPHLHGPLQYGIVGRVLMALVQRLKMPRTWDALRIWKTKGAHTHLSMSELLGQTRPARS